MNSHIVFATCQDFVCFMIIICIYKRWDKDGSDLARDKILHSRVSEELNVEMFLCSFFSPLYCPRAGKIYIEIRSVKGLNAKQRP